MHLSFHYVSSSSPFTGISAPGASPPTGFAYFCNHSSDSHTVVSFALNATTSDSPGLSNLSPLPSVFHLFGCATLHFRYRPLYPGNSFKS